MLAFDETARRNPQAVVDVIRGAFATGMRDFTFNLDSNDFVRITGYLVRKSDLARLADRGRPARQHVPGRGLGGQQSPRRPGAEAGDQR